MGWQIAYSRLPHDFSGLPFKMKKLTQLIKITPQVSGGGLRLQLHNLKSATMKKCKVPK